MTNPTRRLLLLSSALGLILLPALRAQVAPEATASRPAPVDHAAYRGVGSCSAFACHGGNAPDGDHRSAYLTWMARDPHSRAASVLAGELSADIEIRLAGNSGRETLRADRDPKCLACHAAPAGAREASTSRPEGIDCETCHGPASRWLEPHSLPGWKTLSVQQKRARGMTPTKDLIPRAALCARCHVGSSDADVDHDLIAAGHPRLNFELVSYLEALPKHWDTTRERRGVSDFDARAWAIGQVVCAREALGVLSARSRKATWPEFAEYSCSACHHVLDGRLDALRAAADPGSPRWGTWYFAMAGMLVEASDSSKNDASPLARLQRLMDSPSPAQSEAERLANEARAQLDSWIGLEPSRPTLGPDGLRVLASRIKQAALEPTPTSWDGGAQATLALSAVARSLEQQGRPPSPAAKATLQEMRHAIGGPYTGQGSDNWQLDGLRRALERYQP